MIAIIDYQMGNIFSIKNALERVGADVKVITIPEELDNADGIVIPGVGSFGEAMKHILPFKEKIKGAIDSGIPFLGICLGMQVLFERSQESPKDGLGIINGEVIRLPDNVLVPQMGWNELNLGGSGRDTHLLEGIENGDFFYFVHSYYCVPKELGVIAATTEHGTDIASVITKDNIYAVQFHPEKSGEKGLHILKNFLNIIKC